MARVVGSGCDSSDSRAETMSRAGVIALVIVSIVVILVVAYVVILVSENPTY